MNKKDSCGHPVHPLLVQGNARIPSTEAGSKPSGRLCRFLPLFTVFCRRYRVCFSYTIHTLSIQEPYRSHTLRLVKKQFCYMQAGRISSCTSCQGEAIHQFAIIFLRGYDRLFAGRPGSAVFGNAASSGRSGHGRGKIGVPCQ